jgi:hypothetical protein
MTVATPKTVHIIPIALNRLNIPLSLVEEGRVTIAMQSRVAPRHLLEMNATGASAAVT